MDTPRPRGCMDTPSKGSYGYPRPRGWMDTPPSKGLYGYPVQEVVWIRGCMDTPSKETKVFRIIYKGSPSRPHQVAFYDMQGEGRLLLLRSSTGTLLRRSFFHSPAYLQAKPYMCVFLAQKKNDTGISTFYFSIISYFRWMYLIQEDPYTPYYMAHHRSTHIIWLTTAHNVRWRIYILAYFQPCCEINPSSMVSHLTQYIYY